MLETIKKYSYDMFKMFLNQTCIALLALVMTMSTYGNKNLYLITGIGCIIFYVWLLYTMTYEIGQKDKPAIDGGRAKLYPLKGLWISLGANIINIICGIMVAVFSLFIVMQSPVEMLDQNGSTFEAYTRTEVTVAASADSTDTEVEYEYTKVDTLYSDNGGTVKNYEYDGARYSEVVDTRGGTVNLYDSEGNPLDLYSDSGMKVSVTQNSVETWASNLYGVPFTIATFIQSMFVAVKQVLFGGSDFVFLFTPLLPVAFCTLAYYFGVKGKRLLFFLPERKQKPPKHLR